MPPKKDKDHDDVQWRSCIEDAQLNEDKWKIKVVLLEIAGSEQDIIYLNRFETYAKEEKRSVIKNICKSETMFMINQLGAEKKVKDDNLRVFEEGHTFLKEKKDIPPDMLALIIKHLIVKMKEEYILIQKQKSVVKEGMRKESLTMVDRIEVKNNMPIQNTGPVQPIEPSQNKSKLKKGEEDVVIISPKPDEGKKYSTLLRVRGEEWRDKVYVDDYPLDGPNLYLAVTGFLEHTLIENLIKIGVPITAIVQIRIDPVCQKISSGYLTGTKRGQSATELAAEKAVTFWETIQQIRLNKKSADIYKDIAFIVFNPPYRGGETLSSSPENVYDELSYLLYDIQDLTRQHHHYLDNMDVEYIPTENKNYSLFYWYREHVEAVPLEGTSIYFILQSMLETICYEHTDNLKNSRSSLLTAATIRDPESIASHNNLKKTENLVDKVFSTLTKNDFNQRYKVSCGEENNFEDPIIISYGDFIKYFSFHLENLELDNFILSSLINMPFCKLWNNQMPPSDDLKAKVNYHINALNSCFDKGDLDISLLHRLIHMLSFRKLYNNRSSLKIDRHTANTISEFKKVYLKRSTFAEPLLKCSSLFCTSSATSPPSPFVAKSSSYNTNTDFANTVDETMKLLFSCPDLSELVSAAEIEIDKPLDHFIDEYDYFDDFTCINGLQMLLEAYNKFNCLNYKYCEVTDSFVMMFYNDHDSDGISRQEWRCHLPTPVSLQDFFDFVLEEQLLWIQKEEKNYDEVTALKTKLELEESLDQVPARTCIESIEELDSEFLITGSLKYKKKYSNNSFNEEIDQNQSFTKTSPTSVFSTEPNSKNSYKTKSTLNETKKKVKEGLPELNADTFSDIIQCPKQFSGYDLGDRRVEVFGRNFTYFSNDGTRVSTNYSVIIPTNFEYLNLNVISSNCENEFCLHKPLGEEVCTDPESFRIITKGQVIFYLKRNLYQVSEPSGTTSLFDKRSPSRSQSKIKSKRSSTCSKPPVYYMQCTKIYYSFFITWPNGLIIESVHENNKSNISHIKQFYIAPASSLDEDMRCFTLNGEVVIFKKSGFVEVFRPDGTFFKILGCSRNAMSSEEPTEDIRSNISSDRTRKGKNTKSRDRLGRSSLKPSKSTLDHNSILEAKSQYYLSIDEFEFIGNNGIKEKCVKDNFICAEKILMRTATDYCLGEVLTRRMDGTNMLINKDGIQIITFYDNTRIITACLEEDEEIYPELNEFNDDITISNTFESGRLSKNSISNKIQTGQSNSLHTANDSGIEIDKTKSKKREDGFVSIQVIYTIEHAYFATVVINKANGTIAVESANNTSLTVDTANNYHFHLDESTSANFDNQYLDILYKGCGLCHSSIKCKIKMNDVESCNDINQYWLTMKDSFGKTVVVDGEGTISIAEKSEKKESDEKKNELLSENLSEECLTLQGKCKELFEANMYRFFVFQRMHVAHYFHGRNLTCSELVHRMLVKQYETQCRWQPWCTIKEYDSFGDHRSLVSMLTPIQVTEKEKWLMRSKYSNKPEQLKYKDLNVDDGKGFYHWMRPYERFRPKPKEVENIELPRLPRAYILRTLEKLWNEETRKDLKGGKEIIAALLKYRRLLESESQTFLSVPIKDPRTDDEKCIDEKLQAIAKRIEDELKNDLADEVQASAKLTISTKPNGPSKKSTEDSAGEKNAGTCNLKNMWQDRDADFVREVAEVDRPSRNLERYWQHRAEQVKDEEFYKQLLREDTIPLYFRNILGGAMWWEINQAADDAVNISEGEPCSFFDQEDHKQERNDSEKSTLIISSKD